MIRRNAKRFIGYFTSFFIVASLLLSLSEASYRAFLFARNRLFMKGENIFEIYALGGSVAEGAPYERKISFSKIAGRMFGDEIDGRGVVVKNLARKGESIYPQWRRLRLAASYRSKKIPGVVLIYSGHNEDISETFRLTESARLFRWIEQNILSRSFVFSDILYAARRYFGFYRERSLNWYEYFITKSVKVCLGNGLVPILSTVVSNVAGVEPSGSCNDSMKSLVPIFLRGKKLEAENNYYEAVRHYEKAAENHDSIRAVAFYRIGKCYQAEGLYDRAREYFLKAVDEDPRTIIGRVRSTQNAVVRRVAARHAVPVFDAIAAFEKESPHKLVANNLFLDLQHPNVRGQILLGGGFAKEMSRILKVSLKKDDYSPDEIRRLFSLNEDDMVTGYVWAGGILTASLFNHQWPEDRMKVAEEEFKKAVTLNKNMFSGWLGLAFLDAAKKSDILYDKDLMSRWLKMRIFYSPCFPENEFRNLIAVFKRIGVKKELLARTVQTRGA